MSDENSNPTRAHQPRLPRWVRAILAIDRAAHEAVRVEAALRDELLWAWTDPATRDALNEALFAAQNTYLPGGALHLGGLFAWEREALRHEVFATCRRWLLGGAGGGRELFALLETGHAVLAFEPCEALFDGAQKALAGRPNGEIRRASYDDLARAAERGDGPLGDVARWAADGVILGWGSLSHVQTAREREAVLRAVRKVAPEAPVLLSFLPRVESDQGLVARARRAAHQASKSLGAPGVLSEWTAGRGFIPTGGFVARMTEGEARALASRAGYSVERCAMQPYPHAVLRPLTRQ